LFEEDKPEQGVSVRRVGLLLQKTVDDRKRLVQLPVAHERLRLDQEWLGGSCPRGLGAWRSTGLPEEMHRRAKPGGREGTRSNLHLPFTSKI
jgi:hypothetical protein